jgi:hypothetical protein
MAEVLICTGQLLQPAQGPLELAGSLAILPLSGGGFAAEGISAEVLALGQTLRSGAGSGILTAAGVAQRVAGATGGAVEPLAKSEGFKVTVMQGKRAIVTRVKSTGEMRVNVAGKGGMTAAGELSEDRALTHLQNLSSQQLTALVERARELLQAMRR